MKILLSALILFGSLNVFADYERKEPNRDHIIGHYKEYGWASIHQKEYLLGFKVRAIWPITIRKWGVILKDNINNENPNCRIALYTDKNDSPDQLVASSPIFKTVPGRNEIEDKTGTYIDAGYYWIMMNFDKSASLAEDSVGGFSVKFVSLPITGDLPLKITSPSEYVPLNRGPWNLYVLGRQ